MEEDHKLIQCEVADPAQTVKTISSELNLRELERRSCINCLFLFYSVIALNRNDLKKFSYLITNLVIDSSTKNIQLFSKGDPKLILQNCACNILIPLVSIILSIRLLEWRNSDKIKRN
jgi:hypothetical protein